MTGCATLDKPRTYRSSGQMTKTYIARHMCRTETSDIVFARESWENASKTLSIMSCVPTRHTIAKIEHGKHSEDQDVLYSPCSEGLLYDTNDDVCQEASYPPLWAALKSCDRQQPDRTTRQGRGRRFRRRARRYS